MNCKELNEKLSVLEDRVNRLSCKNEFMKGLIGKVGMKKADWEELANQLNDSDVGFNMKFEPENTNIIGRGYIIKKPKNDEFTILIRDTKSANKLNVSISQNGKEIETINGLRPKQILSTVSRMIRDNCEDCVPNAK
jgi:hypothetical protein